MLRTEIVAWPHLAPWWIAAVLACLVLLGGCFQSHDRIREQYSELIRQDTIAVVYYGEEISGGEWRMKTGIDFGDVLAPRLEELLNTDIVWLDSSGYQLTTRQGRSRVQEEVVSFLPDAVFLRFGLADASIAGLTRDNFREEVDRLFTEFDKYNVMPVVFTSFGLRDINPKQDQLYGRLNDFNEIIMWVAGAHRFPLIDVANHMNTLLLSNPDKYRSLFSDESHLNEAGMEYIADFIVDEISDAMGDLANE